MTARRRAQGEVAVDDAFRAEMAAGYGFDEPCLVLGSPLLGDEVASDVRVRCPSRWSTATG
jgi:hypothetical protein